MFKYLGIFLKYFGLVFVLIFVNWQIVKADTIDIWGLSYHTDRSKKFNEQNYGLGYSHSLGDNGTFKSSVIVGALKDSNDLQSYYLGFKVRPINMPFGISTTLMTRQGRIYPAIVPYISLGDKIKFVFVYLPKMDYMKVYETYAIHIEVEVF